MKERLLEQVLQQELDVFTTLDLPEFDPVIAWQKLPGCLFCNARKNKAYVNYRLGWYKCFKCGRDVSVGRNDIVARFSEQIDHAADKCASKFRVWNQDTKSFTYLVPQGDIWQYACMRLLTYAGEPSPHDSDAGKLPDWEIMVKGDPNQLDRYVLAALNRDMQDFAGKEHRRLEREYLADPLEPTPAAKDRAAESGDSKTNLNDELTHLASKYQPNQLRQYQPGYDRSEPLAAYFDIKDYPTLQMVYEYGYKVGEIAQMLRKSRRSVTRMIEQEKHQLLELLFKVAKEQGYDVLDLALMLGTQYRQLKAA